MTSTITARRATQPEPVQRCRNSGFAGRVTDGCKQSCDQDQWNERGRDQKPCGRIGCRRQHDNEPDHGGHSGKPGEHEARRRTKQSGPCFGHTEAAQQPFE